MSELIKFEVAAKTARLIGRENITGLHGAMLELVKNSYDADASFSRIIFRIPFLSIQNEYDALFLEKILSADDLLFMGSFFRFNQEKNTYTSTHDFSNNDIDKLERVLFKYNCIIIVDDGCGMDSEIIRKSWMKIGTNNKESNYISANGRVKTGAKGIGRFALDKLSTHSIVYSKMKNKKTVRWEIDWNSFDKAENLNEIEATLDEMDDCFFDILKNNLGDDIDFFSDKTVSTGTIIILTPTREAWTTRLFSLLNSNLIGLNPLQKADRFDVTLRNVFFPDYSFSNRDLSIDEKDYDYHVNACYDGEDGLTISIQRNELDTSLDELNVVDEYMDNSIGFSANDFWNREAINRKGFNRDDYSKPYMLSLDAGKFVEEDPAQLKNIGKFAFDFYFLKNGNSDLSIVKKISKKRRSEITKAYSGIRIYRDNFKVRPYGENGSPLYDWLGLSAREQKSPAAITNLAQPWRVEPYQIVGQLFISRKDNPLLYDTANREGLAPNDTYLLLIEFLVKIIREFEEDRQLYFREYKKVVDVILANNKKTVRDIINSTQKKQPKSNREKEDNYSKEEYKEAVDYLVGKQKESTDDYQAIYMLCTSGLTTSTFAHEISYPSSLLNSAASHLILCLNRITSENNFKDDDLYNPYKLIKENRTYEKIISSWIDTLISGIKQENLDKNKINIVNVVKKCVSDWKDLLDRVFITVTINNSLESIEYNMSKTDVFLILNNFIINSVWFLDGCFDKEICIDLLSDDKNVIIQMKNNGPSLHPDYKNNPYKIFEIRESKKIDSTTGEKIGTGIGLWMVKRVVDKYMGEIFFDPEMTDGFGFSIRLPKE